MAGFIMVVKHERRPRYSTRPKRMTHPPSSLAEPPPSSVGVGSSLPSLTPSSPPLGVVVSSSGSHTDLAKGTAPHYKAAVKHYATLAEKAVNASHVFDVFACSLDQVGTLTARTPEQGT
jgi:hypothetical protein